MLAYHRAFRVGAAGCVPALALALTLLGPASAQASAPASHPAVTSSSQLAPASGTARTGATAPAAEPAALPAAAAKASAVIPGYSPAALRSAYNVVKAAPLGGRELTVAIVSAYADPRAAADLAVYRKHFHLPACSTGSRCLRILNEHGGAKSLPAPDPTWATTDAIGLDAVSALCPQCHLILLEASSNLDPDLDTAVNTAVAKGAKVVVYGASGIESPAQDVYDHYFNHPGVAIIAPAGNAGAARNFPADLPYVTAVGGTTLTRTSFNARHWAETAWDLTGSGCSALEPKPSWQGVDANPATGCMNRTATDVAADADPATGAAVYNSYGTTQHWVKAGGTMLAGSIVAAVYALAGAPARGTYPASYPYEHHRFLNDVTHGSNGLCWDEPAYICNSRKGFDGPTGMGSPNGTGALSPKGIDPVTVMDPGTQDDEAGSATSFRITGLDSRIGGALRYSAAGLPRGLRISAVPRSTNALISGALPAKVTSYPINVTARDPKTGKRGSARFTLVATGSLTPSSPATMSISNLNDQCLDSGAGTAATAVTIQHCGATTQQWSYVPTGAPGGPAEIISNNLCLSPGSGTVELAACGRGLAAQKWQHHTDGEFQNAGDGKCLGSAASFTNPLTLQPCDSTSSYQAWVLGLGTIQSAVPGMCMATSADASQPLAIVIEPCGSVGQHGLFSLSNNGGALNQGDSCVSGGADGSVTLTCNSNYDGWLLLPDGQLANEAFGVCMDDPGNSAVAGTQLKLGPCYGSLGEIWAFA